MSNGLETTFELLSKTGNEAAIAVLVPALDSPYREIRNGALRALLDRRSQVGQREVLRRLHKLDRSSRELIEQKPGRLSHALRDAVLASDDQIVANGFRATLWLREYDLVPTLINALEDETNVHRDEAAQTLIELARLLRSELLGQRDPRTRRDPELVRSRVVECLEQSTKRFSQHKRLEPIDAFLQLVTQKNATLKQILADPHHGTYLALVAVAQRSQHVGVTRLFLDFLDAKQAPSTALNILAHRSDEGFLAQLFEKIGDKPSSTVLQNIKRIDSIAWVRSEDKSMLTKLDEAAQATAVRFVMLSSMKRLEVFSTIAFMLEFGNVGGRRAAAEALAEFRGGDANKLALHALGDVDPQVQAHALRQLRPRGLPGALQHLIDRLNSPHEAVRQAAREGLPEFSFQRFLSAFDTLDDNVRVRTGALVRQVDTQAVPLLMQELQSKVRIRRIRALEVARTIGLVRELEPTVLELLREEDHMIRVEAAEALSACPTPSALQALRDALMDNSVIVQQAVERSLRALEQVGVERLTTVNDVGPSSDTVPSEELKR